MARLIDADALKIDFYDEYETEDDAYAYGYVSKHQIDMAPTIDAVSVVRCKDCKWCLVEEGGCERIGMVLFADEMENHFCGYGEVRDE